jgi:2-methylcitrate dehydratase PrpD
MARIIRPDVEAAMTLALTRSIGRFIEDLTFDQIPAAAVAIVATGFTDCIACSIAGLDEPVVRIVRDALPTRKDSGEATLLTDATRASAPDAALLNAVAGHVLDYDDVALFGHPSVVMVPAILAEGEALGVTGRDAVCAYLAGYEVWSDLIGRDHHLHHTKGWHPTGIFGTLAAAAAGAKLRQLDAARASHAIGLAAAMAAGLTANFGAMAKALQAGRAAQNGLLAARLAAAGMTAAPDVLEQTPGLLQALSPHGEVDLDREPTFGHDWTILRYGLNLKCYPVVYYCQRALDALFTLLAEHPLRPEQIQRIHVLLSPTEVLILKQHRPQTALEAKFSMEFALTAAIVAGRVGLRELTDTFVQRPEVQALFPRVHFDTTDVIDPDMLTRSHFTQVTVALTDGTILQSPQVFHARGSAQTPLTHEELWDKFRDCTSTRLSEIEARRVFDRLQDLEQVKSVAAVLRAAVVGTPA